MGRAVVAAASSPSAPAVVVVVVVGLDFACGDAVSVSCDSATCLDLVFECGDRCVDVLYRVFDDRGVDGPFT